MHEVTLQAHFDGKQIVLDDPYELEPDIRLMITVLFENKISDEREAWQNLSLKGLEKVYHEDEPEYTLDMIRRPNPNYERRCVG